MAQQTARSARSQQGLYGGGFSVLGITPEGVCKRVSVLRTGQHRADAHTYMAADTTGGATIPLSASQLAAWSFVTLRYATAAHPNMGMQRMVNVKADRFIPQSQRQSWAQILASIETRWSEVDAAGIRRDLSI